MPAGAKAYEKAEDPIYALENNLPIDVQHYLDHQLAQPLMRIFEPVCKDVKAELLSGEAAMCCCCVCLVVFCVCIATAAHLRACLQRCDGRAAQR
jgi:hypothetical protein